MIIQHQLLLKGKPQVHRPLARKAKVLKQQQQAKKKEPLEVVWDEEKDLIDDNDAATSEV